MRPPGRLCCVGELPFGRVGAELLTRLADEARLKGGPGWRSAGCPVTGSCPRLVGGDAGDRVAIAIEAHMAAVAPSVDGLTPANPAQRPVTRAGPTTGRGRLADHDGRHLGG
jgi:hypothetical protein